MQRSIAIVFAAYAAQYTDARTPLMRRGADVSTDGSEQRTMAAQSSHQYDRVHAEVEAGGSARLTLHSKVQHQQKVSNHVDQAPIRSAVTWDGKSEAISKLGLSSNASLLDKEHQEDKKLADKVHELHELLVDHDAEDDAEDVFEVEELFGHSENKKLSQLHTWGRRRKSNGVPSCDEIEGKKSCRRRWFNGCPAAEDATSEPDAKPACRRRWFRCPRETADEPLAIPDNWYASSSEVNEHNVALGAMLDSLNGMWTQQKKPYPEEYKRAIYAQFAEKGNISDPVVIDAGVISTGMFEWMFRLAVTNGGHDDPWAYKQGIGKMYDESYNEGKFENGIRAPMPASAWPVSKDHTVPIIEPCNTMSNMAFYQAGQYINERTWPWKEEDTAMLIAGFGAMGAGSVFFHGTGLKIGHWNDAIGIDIVTWGLYELMVKAVLEVAQPSEEDKVILLTFGNMTAGNPGREAIDAVVGLTDLFSLPYDQWIHSYSDKVKLPAYTMSIAAMVLTTLWIFHDDHEFVLEQIGWGPEKQEELLLAFGLEGEMFDFLTKQFYPALQRSLDKTYICGIDKTTILERFVKFALTFIDAFLYQEKVVRKALAKDTEELEKFEKNRKTYQDWSQMLLTVIGASNDLITSPWDNYDGHHQYCDMYTTHYKWHEKAADGLLQMVELAKTITKSLHPVKEGSKKHDMRCYKGMYCAAEKTTKNWYDTVMNPMEWR